MSNLYQGPDYENDWIAIGRYVWFDGPHGERMHGEIVRTSSNPTYFHVMVDGQRYEVDLHADNVSRDK